MASLKLRGKGGGSTRSRTGGFGGRSSSARAAGRRCRTSLSAMENFNPPSCVEKRERLRVCLLLYIGTGSIQSQCVRHFAIFAPDRQVISE